MSTQEPARTSPAEAHVTGRQTLGVGWLVEAGGWWPWAEAALGLWVGPESDIGSPGSWPGLSLAAVLREARPRPHGPRLVMLGGTSDPPPRAPSGLEELLGLGRTRTCSPSSRVARGQSLFGAFCHGPAPGARVAGTGRLPLAAGWLVWVFSREPRVHTLPVLRAGWTREGPAALEEAASPRASPSAREAPRSRVGTKQIPRGEGTCLSPGLEPRSLPSRACATWWRRERVLPPALP